MITFLPAHCRHYGQEGYRQAALRMHALQTRVEQAVAGIPSLRLLVRSDCAIVPITSDVFDIYKLATLMDGRGWNVFTSQDPPAMGLCLVRAQLVPSIVMSCTIIRIAPARDLALICESAPVFRVSSTTASWTNGYRICGNAQNTWLPIQRWRSRAMLPCTGADTLHLQYLRYVAALTNDDCLLLAVCSAAKVLPAEILGDVMKSYIDVKMTVKPASA